MKDVGPFHYYLGMTQRKYALELLDSKPAAEPMDPISKLSSRDEYLLRDPSTYLQNINILTKGLSRDLHFNVYPYTLPTCGGDEDTTNVAMPNTPATPVQVNSPSLTQVQSLQRIAASLLRELYKRSHNNNTSCKVLGKSSLLLFTDM
ncbi:hypothetical protein Tco_0911726 [Tanacetum coccineum]|uniref:Uncharacterized protein n=1 Tax=Tanacetum coccineum TaxID=301880 RepID=A0ABQ5CWJ1_9ASTR